MKKGFHQFAEQFYQFEILTPTSHLTNIYSHKKKGIKMNKIINTTLLVICYNTSSHSKVNIHYN